MLTFMLLEHYDSFKFIFGFSKQELAKYILYFSISKDQPKNSSKTKM